MQTKVVALRAMNNGWIDVNDRLPEDNGDTVEEYLVFNGNHRYVCEWNTNRVTPDWTDDEDRLQTGITHWQPLPDAPPQTEKQER